MKRKTIRNHKDFITSKDDIWVRSVCFIVKIKNPAVPTDPRYGLVVPKKKFQKAVERNLAKRKIRDWISHNEEYMNLNMDYIFIINEQILDYSRDLGYCDMCKALKRISKEYKKTNEK